MPVSRQEEESAAKVTSRHVSGQRNWEGVRRYRGKLVMGVVP
jgi:hypothetical protein